MRRQFGAMLVTLVLMCAPLAWSQNDSSSSSSSSDSSSTTSSSNSSPSSSPGGFSPTTSSSNPSPTTSPDGFSPTPSSTDSSSSHPVTSGTLFTTWAQDETVQSGSTGDSTQGSPDDTTQSGVSGSQDTFLNAEKLPALSLFHEATSHTGLTWNFDTGTLLSRPSGGTYNGSFRTLSSFSSGLAASQLHERYAWVLSYQGGINITHGGGLNAFNNLNQSANGAVRWRLAKTWSLKASDNYFYSDNPFTPFLTYVGTPTPNNPNPVVYFPQSVIEQNQGKISVSHPLSEHDTIIFYGGESFQRYLRSGSAYTLWNNYTYSGSAFYQHEFSSRLSAGGGYQFLAVDYGHGASRSGIGTFEGFIDYKLSPRVEVSGWIGPQRTGNKSIVCTFFFGNNCFAYTAIHTSQFSLAEGGSVKWKKSSVDGFGVEFTHNVSNGGLNLGIANIYQITGTYNRRLKNKWVLGTSLFGGKNNSINAFRGNQYLYNVSAVIGLSHDLSDSWRFYGYYLYVRQKQNYIGLPSSGSDNGVGFDLRYTLHFGLGR